MCLFDELGRYPNQGVVYMCHLYKLMHKHRWQCSYDNTVLQDKCYIQNRVYIPLYIITACLIKWFVLVNVYYHYYIVKRVLIELLAEVISGITTVVQLK